MQQDCMRSEMAGRTYQVLLDAEKEARLVGGGGGGLADGAAQQHPRRTHHRLSHQSVDAGTRDRSSQRSKAPAPAAEKIAFWFSLFFIFFIYFAKHVATGSTPVMLTGDMFVIFSLFSN